MSNEWGSIKAYIDYIAAMNTNKPTFQGWMGNQTHANQETFIFVKEKLSDKTLTEILSVSQSLIKKP